MENLIPAVFIGGVVYLLGNAYANRNTQPLSNFNPSTLSGTPVIVATGGTPLFAEKVVEGNIVTNNSDTLSPAAAYELLRAGRYKEVLPKKISKYFYWKEVFTSSAFNNKNYYKTTPLSVLNNAKRHADKLDRVREVYGSPMSIASWYRPAEYNRAIGGATNSQHIQGTATDFNGSYNTKRAIYNAAKSIGWQGGMGISNGNFAVTKLHLDSGSTRYWAYNSAGAAV